MLVLKSHTKLLPEVMGGRKPKLLMDIHNVSEVNKPELNLVRLKDLQQ